MRKILYTMHFIGQTSTLVSDCETLRTTGSAASCVLSTMIGPRGMQADLRASDGDLAFFESELQMTGPEGFQESGQIAFGGESEHLLRFSTVGKGHVTAGFEPGTMAGAATWKVESGEGQFAAARGFITSNFTIDNSGERSDFHCGLIFLPD